MFAKILNAAKNFHLKNWFIIYSFLVLTISFLTFFVNYQNPPAPFWDENYHISSGYKYIKGAFFVELHPPLGKMLIGAGEQIFNPNKDLDTKDFLVKDYLEGKDFNNFSFVGVRFFPAFFAFLSGYLFFLLLFVISKNPHLSALFSSLFLFENALIVHYRGAMLDGIQMFFILASLIWFVLLWRKANPKQNILQKTKIYSNLNWKNYLVLGVFIGLAVSVKINALVLGILVASLLFWEYSFDKLFVTIISSSLKNLLETIKTKILVILPSLIIKGMASLFGICFVFGFIQYIHLNIATDVKDNKYYDVSSNYRDILEKRSFANPLNTWVVTKDWYDYSQRHSKGVPKLDVCKVGENGSYPADWPLMNKTISYRWQKYAVQKDKHFTYAITEPDQKYQISLNDYNNLKGDEKDKYVVPVKYLYLIGNPAIWLIALLSLIASVSLVFAKLFFGLKDEKNEEKENKEEFENLKTNNSQKDSNLENNNISNVNNKNKKLKNKDSDKKVQNTLEKLSKNRSQDFSWQELMFEPKKDELITKSSYYFSLILVILTLYGFYMFSVLRVDRVLYLYHYLVPFVFSLILAFLVFNFRFVQTLNNSPTKAKNLYLVLGFLVFIVFVNFVIFAPFTYYLPLTREEFDFRNWLYFWQMKNAS